MKSCPRCKKEYQDTKRFCGRCGLELVEERPFDPIVYAKSTLFESRIAENPDNVEIRLEYADYLVKAGDHQSAIRHLEESLKIDPNRREIREKLADTYESRADWDRAAAELIILVNLEPTNIQYKNRLAEAFESGRRLDDAVDILSELIRLDPTNTSYLIRQRDLLAHLRKDDDFLSVCRRIVQLDSADVKTWALLGDGLIRRGSDSEASVAFQSVLSQRPSDPRANLYVGIAKHNSVLEEPNQEDSLEKAIVHLELAGSGTDTLSRDEEKLRRLYLLSARLSSQIPGEEELDLGPSSQWEWLPQKHIWVLQRCYKLLAESSRSAGKIEEAIGCYINALKSGDDSNARLALITVLSRQGEELDKSGMYEAAEGLYERGLEVLPEHSDLRARYEDLVNRRKRRARVLQSVAVATIVLIVAVAAFQYFGQEALEIRTSLPATVLLYKDGNAIPLTKEEREDVVYHVSSLLKYGTYDLRVEKVGYKPIKETVKVGMGRRRESIQIQLVPQYAIVKINTEPPGAHVTLKNQYERRTCTTPCKMYDVFALHSEVEVELPGYTPYRMRRSIVAESGNDLGTIVFRGNVKLDSSPSGATVFIDGDEKGRTPILVEGLPARKVNLRLWKRNGGIYFSEVLVRPQDTVDLGIVSLSKEGALQVTSKPLGASVSVDGEKVGVTPVTLSGVKAGKHQIRLSYGDCPPHTSTFDLRPGQVLDLGEIGFMGSIDVDSDPPGANVYLRGKHAGVTPLRIDEVLAGRVAVSLKHENAASYRTEFDLEAGTNHDLGKILLVTWLGDDLCEGSASYMATRIRVTRLEDGQLSGKIQYFVPRKCKANLIFREADDRGFLFDQEDNRGDCRGHCRIWIKRDGSSYQELCGSEVKSFGRLYNRQR